MGSRNDTTIKANRIYRQLRDAILSGRLKAGTHLRELVLAAKFRVSRTPVREALRQLERDGQVRLTPRVGAQVMEVSLQDLFEVLEMRRCLEPYAARIAATRVTPAVEAELGHFRKTFENITGCDPAPAVIDRHITADRRLHELILKLAGNRRVAQAIMTLNHSIQRYRYVGISHRFRQSAQEHLDLLDALLRRDAVAAESAMTRHLIQFTEDMQRLLVSRIEPGIGSMQSNGSSTDSA